MRVNGCNYFVYEETRLAIKITFEKKKEKKRKFPKKERSLENLYATDDGARAREPCAASLLVAGGGFDEAARADERRAFLLLLSFFSFFLNSSRKVRERAFPSVEVFTRERERERERERKEIFSSDFIRKSGAAWCLDSSWL